MAKRPKKYVEKILALRARLWPDLIEDELWYHKKNDGFLSIPRTMPYIMAIIDDLTKGTPASSTYLDLFCRTLPEMYVSLSDQDKLAYGAGFRGQRARRQWIDRIRQLRDLGFILTAPGQNAEFAHAVIINPHIALKRLWDKRHPGLTKLEYDAFVERAIDIGATDADQDPKAPPPASSFSSNMDDDLPF